MTVPITRLAPQIDGRLAAAFCHANQAANELADALDGLSADTTLPAAIDIVTAKAHLRAAQRLIDQVAQRITAEAVAL